MVYLLLAAASTGVVVSLIVKCLDRSRRRLVQTEAGAPEQADFLEVIGRVQGLLSSSQPGLRLKHVLVPIDFSESSLKAIPYACLFARQFGCTVTLLHVVHLNIVGEERGVPLSRLVNEMKLAAVRSLEYIASSFDLAAARIAVRVGVPATEVLQEVTESGVDLVVLGRYRKSGVWRMLAPSVGRKIMSGAPCPSLVAL